MITTLTNIFNKLFFIAALVVLLISLWDSLLRLFGWTFSWISYSPGRMLEFSAMLMIFAIGFLLRQIREELKNK